MSDESWRSRRDDDFSEFGSLFDDAESTQNLPPVAGEPDPDDPTNESEAISFGDSDTGSLPHWTEPPTGEIPRFDVPESADDPDEDDELDVWSSFSSESPVWKDDEPADPSDGVVVDEQLPTAQHRRVSDEPPPISGQHRRVTGESAAVQTEPSRITIGTDPSGMPRRQPPSGRRRGGGPPPRAAGAPAPRSSGRDMPVAIAVGLVLAGAFLAALMYRPVAVAALVVVTLGLAAVEFYDKVAEKGYRPAVVPGIVACVAAPLAAYWLGVGALPLVIAFGFMATAGSFIGARSVEAGPMPNVSITTLGMIWIGLLGSFSMLILRFSTNSGSLLEVAEHRGTDTLFLLALGVVANDVGALFVGSAVGRTPLRHWISPNKTVEGFMGGAMLTVIAMLLVGISESSSTWSSNWHLLALAVVISIMAPMGDLVESMFKRNLDVKDFGSIVKGHGGILDRFDGFLFTLPAVYYLTLVLEPWTQFSG
ncbi:phosphatidate cytidylyltransferase [Ilumatobacter sp.]|uniref:phosphatidate cytidylyltransferase n=1 Tax=Ilumatobacter sp. TaxID=1967498 RepID=UPI003AF714FA